MAKDMFEDSETLSRWVSDILEKQGIDEIARWRMLEYWMQVELYRAIEAGEAGQWRHLGDFEQPYYTDLPRSGSKYNTKWVDMVLVSPSIEMPDKLVWIELKDIGRNAHTFTVNLKGLGQDLAALWKLRVKETREIWLNPPPHASDKSRISEWESLVHALDVENHYISQIVIMPNKLVSDHGEAEAVNTWLSSFAKRVGLSSEEHGVELAKYESGKFSVFSVILPLPEPGDYL